MNRRTTLAFVLFAAGLACTTPRPDDPPRAPSGSTEQVEPVPSALTAETENVERSAGNDAITYASKWSTFERGSAGFHLIRPLDDPWWRLNPLQSGRDYSWSSVLVRYADVEYQRRWPVEIQRAPNLGACILSVARQFPNALFAPLVANQPDSRFRVEAQLSPHSLEVLKRSLATRFAIDADYVVDWFGTSRRPDEAPTKCEIVLVADGVAYLPIDVGALVRDARAGERVVLARDLDEATARRIAVWLEVP